MPTLGEIAKSRKFMTAGARSVLNRWIYVSCLGVAAAIAFYVILPAGPIIADRIIPSLGASTFAAWFVWLLWFLLACAVLLLVSALLRARLSQLRLALRFPPTWYAVVIALGIVVSIERCPSASPLPRGEVPTTFLAISLTGVALVHLLAFVHRSLHGTRASGAVPIRLLSSLSWNEVSSWAARELPASPDDPDLFGASPLARRVATRLGGTLGCDESIAIVGPFGGGKSTVVRWIERHLAAATDPRVWTCELNCWGLAVSAEVPHFVLNQAIRKLEEHIDCLSVRGLPTAYQKIISTGTPGWASALLESVGGEADPVEQLRRLSPILLAANARLVLIIEDVDRAGNEFNPNDVQRLLLNLRSVSGVTFLVTADQERCPLDLQKLCDHIEVLPRVEPPGVRDLLSLLRTSCQERFAYIDPVRDRADLERFLDLHPARGEIEEYARREYSNTLPDAVAELVQTPRGLKRLVRRIERTWEHLFGEVDLDDLLLVTTLREGAPRCFEFLVRNRHPIRNRRNPLGEAQDKADPLKEAWDSLVAEHGSAGSAIGRIVEALAFERLASRNTASRPQGLQNDEPTDYFQRLLAEDISAGELRDQKVLSDMRTWLSENDGPLVGQLVGGRDRGSRYVRIWEHLSIYLPDIELLVLARTVVDAVIQQDGGSASGEHAAILALWRRCNRRVARTEATTAWLEERVDKAMDASLDLVNDLYYYWASARHGVVDAEGRKSVRRRITDQAKGRVASGSVLLRILDPARPHSVRRLVQPADQEESPSVLTEPANWAWLGPILLEAANGEKELIGREIVHLLGDSSSPRALIAPDGTERTVQWTLNRERALVFFGDRVPEALKIVTQVTGDEGFLADARGQASEWLAALPA